MRPTLSVDSSQRAPRQRFAFGWTRESLVERGLFDSEEEYERAADVVLFAAALRAGCVQGSDGVWSTGR